MVAGWETGPESIPMKKSFAGREFQFWLYRVSHGELLVRSPKDAVHPRNIDLMFAGVEYVDLPRSLPALEVDEPKEADLARAQERLGRPLDRQSVVVLESHGRRYVVVAPVVRLAETDMEIFESPFA